MSDEFLKCKTTKIKNVKTLTKKRIPSGAQYMSKKQQGTKGKEGKD